MSEQTKRGPWTEWLDPKKLKDVEIEPSGNAAFASALRSVVTSLVDEKRIGSSPVIADMQDNNLHVSEAAGSLRSIRRTAP